MIAERIGEQEREIRRQQMASLGRLLADFSHEIRNHLAVIQEANGLLEDMLAMEESEANPLLASLEDTTGQIRQRVRRSAELCQYLSAMAHRSDTPLSSFSVNDLLSELMVLLECSARSRQVTLQLEPGRGIEPIYNEPALLQYILYQLYVFSSDLLSNGQTLTVSTTQAAGSVEIRFRLNGVPQADLSGISETASAAIASLGACLKRLDRRGEEPADSAGFRLLGPSLYSVG